MKGSRLGMWSPGLGTVDPRRPSAEQEALGSLYSPQAFVADSEDTGASFVFITVHFTLQKRNWDLLSDVGMDNTLGSHVSTWPLLSQSWRLRK